MILAIEYEDGRQLHTTQGYGKLDSADFQTHRKQSIYHPWEEIHKAREYFNDSWYDEVMAMQGLSGGLNVTDGNLAVSAVDIENRSVTLGRQALRQNFPTQPTRGLSSGAALRQLQEQQNAEMMQYYEITMRRAEANRRAAQSEQDRRRTEEERNRPRNPWNRFRNWINE